MNTSPFGTLHNGNTAHIYSIHYDNIEAKITDFGATLVSLFVPDRTGILADIVLGFDSAQDYAISGAFLGATVGRNANRIANARFSLNGNTYTLEKNNNSNNLHSGSDSYAFRLWNVAEYTESSIRLTLDSPDGDQGFPGNAHIQVTYALEDPGTLRITYEGICDTDTIFNMTNHSYFNLAGHDHPELAMQHTLSLASDTYIEVDAQAIPTGKLESVGASVMDFRIATPLCKHIHDDFPQLTLMGGYDHCYVVNHSNCAVLSDPTSGRTMQVITDCPGVQVYTANELGVAGKAGVYYTDRSAVCLETQYYPDAVHHPHWPQPIVKAGEKYFSETKYVFVETSF